MQDKMIVESRRIDGIPN